jgi:predicted ATP-binding protein involved in virulence
VDRRFLYKSLCISKSDGFFLQTSSGRRLEPDNLSSGEQHEIVVLFQLLFQVREDSIILIDEPELSLHIAWQQQFLSDLEQITTLAKFDVIIATHSPQIISNRWDLTEELKAPDHA